MSEFHGDKMSDPRLIQRHIANQGYNCWLDVINLTGEHGLFEEISSALQGVAIVVACVSTEYAKSDNCRMEIQVPLTPLSMLCQFQFDIGPHTHRRSFLWPLHSTPFFNYPWA